jgi:Uma2 family endonuclease
MAVALGVRKWTLAEMHRLPDDGNKYELVRGELFVTPPPSDEHETILARLAALLAPYVEANGLGYVYHPRAVMRYKGSEVEPDLMVRRGHPKAKGNDRDWNTAPTPTLVVEVLSGHTRRRDHGEKQQLYMDAGVPEYWIVDPEDRTVTVVRHCEPERVVDDVVTWRPREIAGPLTILVARIFGDGRDT